MPRRERGGMPSRRGVGVAAIAEYAAVSSRDQFVPPASDVISQRHCLDDHQDWMTTAHPPVPQPLP